MKPIRFVDTPAVTAKTIPGRAAQRPCGVPWSAGTSHAVSIFPGFLTTHARHSQIHDCYINRVLPCSVKSLVTAINGDDIEVPYFKSLL